MPLDVGREIVDLDADIAETGRQLIGTRGQPVEARHVVGDGGRPVAELVPDDAGLIGGRNLGTLPSGR